MAKSDTAILQSSEVVTTTLYDLFVALQCLCGPDNDDFVISLVVYWLLSGHLRPSAENLHEHRCPHGGFGYE